MIRPALFLIPFLLMTALFFVSIGEAAGDKWIYLAGTKQDPGFSYDRESIMPLGADTSQVWTKRIGRDSSEIRVLNEVNCSQKIIRDVQMVVERRSAAAPVQTRDRAWRGVVRGTPEGELFNVLCRRPAPEPIRKPQSPMK